MQSTSAFCVSNVSSPPTSRQDTRALLGPPHDRPLAAHLPRISFSCPDVRNCHDRAELTSTVANDRGTAKHPKVSTIHVVGALTYTPSRANTPFKSKNNNKIASRQSRDFRGNFVGLLFHRVKSLPYQVDLRAASESVEKIYFSKYFSEYFLKYLWAAVGHTCLRQIEHPLNKLSALILS